MIILTMMAFDRVSAQKIAFSRGGPEAKYLQYIDWLKSVDDQVEYVDLWGMPLKDALGILESCSGLVITGGPDIYPALYGRENELHKCGKTDRERDTFELSLLRKAKELNLPLLAVCRGAQLLNVYEGGTIYTDIPLDLPSPQCHRLKEGDTCYHEVKVVPGTLLAEITRADRGIVNSFHHQGVDHLAPVFVPMATTGDGLIEAFGWKQTSGRPFLLAVQWHPEKMQSEAFCLDIATRFITEVRKVKSKVK